VRITEYQTELGCFGKQKKKKKKKYIKHTNDFTGIIISKKKRVEGSWYFAAHFLKKTDKIENSRLEDLAVPENLRNRALFLSLEFDATSNISQIFLQFENEEDKTKVENCLKNLITTHDELTPADHQMLRLWRIFNEVDANRKGKLNKNEIIKFFKRVEIKYSDVKNTVEQTLRTKNQSDGWAKGMTVSDGLDWAEVKFLYGQLLIPESLRSLLKKNDKTNDGQISRSEFMDFLISQKMEYVYLRDKHGEMQSYCSNNESDVSKVMKIFDRDGSENMTQEEFNAFILKCCNAIDPKAYTFHQDMKRPMTEYYIASSHNTYLEGDQLNGPCSLQAYIRSIQRGCRCVEIDCWNDDDEPSVYHGYCPCKRTRLAFRDVVNECAKYAFEEDKPYSKFPFILSLENHCNIRNQKKMADYIKEAFGERLVTRQLRSDEDKMPSPEEIGPRCIVKGKKLKEIALSDVADSNNDDYDLVDEEDESAETEHGEKEAADTDTDGRTPKKKLKLHRDLSDITIYTVSRHLKSFNAPAAGDDYKYISSIKEGKGEDIIKEESANFVKHTNRELARIYPNGSRFYSDNYDPMPFWAHGCQVVALNYQTDCKERLKNQIMFQINGNCGYVRKPSLLRSPNFDPNDKNQVPVDKTKFTIKIISGQQFHNARKNSGKAGDVCDPYVRLELVSGSKLEDPQKHKTSTVKNNGFK
jgi:Ca2+-binding EF-hand superfamily protein